MTDLVRVRIPFVCGLLAWPDFCDAIAYGRSHGCTVDLHRGGGWIVRRGWIVASGPRDRVAHFLKSLNRVFADGGGRIVGLTKDPS